MKTRENYYVELLYDLLEPYAVKVARTVLRGEGISNNPDLPDNSQNTGQVILSTISHIKQPDSKLYQTAPQLPMITDEYGQLLTKSERDDNTPSCSLAEALEKQDLFINSTLANMAASLLWNLFRQGFTENRGFFLNLKDFRCTPVKV